jgi:hypothetical protein
MRNSKKLNVEEIELLLNMRSSHFKEGDFKIINYYFDKKNSLIENKYGILKVDRFYLSKGVKPTIQTAVDKRLYFENMAKEIHGGKYDYSMVDYKSAHKNVKIICDIHGIFEQTYANHISAESGCLKCSQDNLSKKLSSNTFDFIQKSKIIHENKYDYLKVDYISAKNKVIITCKKHGDFNQTPNSHLNGGGCISCNNEKTSFSLSNWRLMCGNNNGVLYVLECFNDDEKFIKIGITCQSIKKRYNKSNYMPYKYNIFEIIESPDRGYIWDLENEYKKYLRSFKYSPKIEFPGSITECFTIESIETLRVLLNKK